MIHIFSHKMHCHVSLFIYNILKFFMHKYNKNFQIYYDDEFSEEMKYLLQESHLRILVIYN